MADASTSLAFERLGSPPGIEVVDRIEQQRYSIHTPEAVAPDPTATDTFRFPVGRAIEFTTTALSLPTVVGVFVHDADGTVVAEVDHLESASLPGGEYTLGLSTQIKTYVEVEGPIEIDSSTAETTIEFDRPTTVRLGVRSRHDHPAATVTTTAEPEDLVAAIETFGSALKATTPERSYPTLRGHPPAVELGDELDVPDGLESPDTGVTLELPLDRETLFVAAPLVYYLGASIEPGPAPRLVTDDGFEYSLDGPDGYQTTVGNTLKQVFFLDCITRTEGLYQMPLDERERIEPLVDLDFAELYDRPLAAQVATYLEVPFAVVEDHLPEWPLTTHVQPTAETVEQLPFVVDDLAVIRSIGSTPSTDATAAAAGPEPAADVLTRSASSQEGGAEDTFVQPAATDTVEQAWIGDDIPIGASKLTTEAFRNRLDREMTAGDIEIAVVLNDDRMSAERDVVDRVYGNRENLPFEITVHRNTTVAELRTLLGRQRGFLHYIGHTEGDGFECADGKLDAESLDQVGIDSFLLNACNSYRQGLALIEAGAIGGIVTLAEIINDEAVAMGGSVARLLNAGFPLRASLTIAREESIQGGQYIVVGDGGMSVTQAEGLSPNLVRMKSVDDGFEVEFETFATEEAGIGTLYMPHIPDVDQYCLSSGLTPTFEVTEEFLEEFLAFEEFPIKANGTLYWSSSVDLGDLR